MAELTLQAEAGRSAGTRPSRRLRHEGRIPGVIYGPGVDAIPVSVAARDLRTVLSTEAGLNAVLSVRLDGKSFLTLAREIQRHPVRGTVTHVDFQVVDPNREVAADVPINLVGDPVELHRSDGVLEQQMFALTIRSRPADIPTHFELDITDLVIGASVRVADVALPEGVATDVDPESIVAIGQPPRVVVEEVPEGEEVEGEEGAEGEAPAGEAAEGEAPAEGGGDSSREG